MSLRDDLKLFIPKFLWSTINHPQGYVVTPEEFNSQWNLNVAQGDHTSLTMQQTLTMLYQTILSDTEGAVHLMTQVPGVTATDVRNAILELRTWMDAEQARVNAAAAAETTRVNGQITRLDGADANLQGQITADVQALATHKTSADHDGRYFTEAEVTAIQGALQGQINTASATITTLQNQLNALDNTFSTDAERLAAIQEVINSFNLADDDLEALIVGKADKSEVYTKAQIDGMTLGAYKFGFFTNKVTIETFSETVPVGISEWNPETDPLMVYVGGLYQTPDVDYTVDTVNKTVSSDWLEGFVVDFFVVKNVRVVVPEDYVDGFLLLGDSVQRSALAPAVKVELDDLRSNLNSLDTTVMNIALDVESLHGKAEFKTGTGNFVTGLTQVVNDAFITADTFVNVTATGTKNGTWTVDSAAGSFTITSDTAETNCAFEWNATKAGA